MSSMRSVTNHWLQLSRTDGYSCHACRPRFGAKARSAAFRRLVCEMMRQTRTDIGAIVAFAFMNAIDLGRRIILWSVIYIGIGWTGASSYGWKRTVQNITRIPSALTRSAARAVLSGYPVTENQIDAAPTHVKISIGLVSRHGVAYRDPMDQNVYVAHYGVGIQLQRGSVVSKKY